MRITTTLLMTLSVTLMSSQTLATDKPHALITIEESEDKPSQVTSYYKDLDQDGVPDKQDHCLNSGFGYKVDAFGCELDSDGDGIYDRHDQCPNTPRGTKVNFLGCEGDEDKDLVLDSTDRCPGTPVGTKVNAVGCKVNNDFDGDGVINQQDQCPRTPKGTIVNKFGCKPRNLVITNIVFNSGSFEIRADQKSILDKDISRLREVKANEIVLVTGFTDSQGSAASNLKLSWNRAQSTKDYIVKNFNYNEKQIMVSGKGEASPVATNATEQGRQKNRRIQFKIMKKNEVPSNAKQNIPDNMKGYSRYRTR